VSSRSSEQRGNGYGLARFVLTDYGAAAFGSALRSERRLTLTSLARLRPDGLRRGNLRLDGLEHGFPFVEG